MSHISILRELQQMKERTTYDSGSRLLMSGPGVEDTQPLLSFKAIFIDAADSCLRSSVHVTSVHSE